MSVDAKTVIIRADASSLIGTGHVMRCLAVAEVLAEHGVEVTFASCQMIPPLVDRITAAGAGWVDLHAAPGGDHDLSAFLRLIGESRPAAVMLDGYCFGENYRRKLAQAGGHPVLAFDDMADLPVLWADFVVNPAPNAAAMGYERKAPGAVLLLGPAYAPLRRDIRQAAALPPLPWSERNRVLVTFGGSDPTGLTGPTLACLAKMLPPDVGVDVAVGGGNPRIDALTALAATLTGTITASGLVSETARVTLHRDTRDMGGLMRRAGLAISAGGGAIGELAALATPTLLVVAVDNQAPAAADATGMEVIEARRDTPAEAGDHPPAETGFRIAAAAAALWRNVARRQEMSAAISGVVDGQGAVRIATALMTGRRIFCID